MGRCLYSNGQSLIGPIIGSSLCILPLFVQLVVGEYRFQYLLWNCLNGLKYPSFRIIIHVCLFLIYLQHFCSIFVKHFLSMEYSELFLDEFLDEEDQHEFTHCKWYCNCCLYLVQCCHASKLLTYAASDRFLPCTKRIVHTWIWKLIW